MPENSVTNISSDYASLDHGGKANKFNVKNNVVVKNADMSLECDELEVDSLKSGEEKIGEIRARGNVRMSTDLRKASANALSIFPSKNEAVLSGNPR
ncbi:MAG: LptA/OstA family protein [Bacilli bacterium]